MDRKEKGQPTSEEGDCNSISQNMACVVFDQAVLLLGIHVKEICSHVNKEMYKAVYFCIVYNNRKMGNNL